MRILHFTESFSNLSETFIYDYIKELERQGVEGHVATFRRKNPEERPFPRVNVVDRPSRWHPRRLWHRALVPFGIGEARTSDWPQIRKRMERVVRCVNPNVIHAHFGPAGVLVAPLAKQLDVPLVVTFYGYDISSLVKESFWKASYDELWTQVSAVTVLSEEMKARAIDHGCPPGKLKVVHLSRDLENFQLELPDSLVKSLLFVGRLVPKKAPLDAIQALKQANERGAELTLDLLGEGPLRKEIEQYVKGHALSDSVKVHGRVSNDEVSSRMEAADAFILPSKTAPNGDREGTPTVLVEAQAIGLPCVSTRHAGIPEMIPDANQDLLVAEGNVEALASVLCMLAEKSLDDLKQRARRGRQKVERDFSLSSETEKIRNTYISCQSNVSL